MAFVSGATFISSFPSQKDAADAFSSRIFSFWLSVTESVSVSNLLFHLNTVDGDTFKILAISETEFPESSIFFASAHFCLASSSLFLPERVPRIDWREEKPEFADHTLKVSGVNLSHTHLAMDAAVASISLFL